MPVSCVLASTAASVRTAVAIWGLPLSCFVNSRDRADSDHGADNARLPQSSVASGSAVRLQSPFICINKLI